VDLKYGDIFKEKLNVKVIVKQNMKHFGDNDDFLEMPIVVESLSKIST